MATVPFSSTYTDTTNISCTLDADEEQTQSMAGFESACTERIQPFDDSESDEEVHVSGEEVALYTCTCTLFKCTCSVVGCGKNF